MASQILNALTSLGNIIIIIFGFILFILMGINYTNIKNSKKHLKDLIERQNKKYELDATNKIVNETNDSDHSVTPDTVRNAEKIFNNYSSTHNMFAQLIPLFPLLGIAGTVWGLMEEVGAENIEQMLSSLNLAMTTTFNGLIGAIIFKSLDAIFPSKTINDVDVMLDDYYKKIDLAKMFEDSKNIHHQD